MDDKKTTDDVPIFREFPDVFPKDLPRVPPKRQVDFCIDLIPGVDLIAKAPYCLAPPLMQELSTQLHELLGKGFIRLSNSLGREPIMFVEKNNGSLRMCINYR